MNYNLKIHTHLALGQELRPAFSGKVQTLHLKIEDLADENMLTHFPEICNFIGNVCVQIAFLMVHNYYST